MYHLHSVLLCTLPLLPCASDRAFPVLRRRAVSLSEDSHSFLSASLPVVLYLATQSADIVYMGTSLRPAHREQLWQQGGRLALGATARPLHARGVRVHLRPWLTAYACMLTCAHAALSGPCACGQGVSAHPKLSLLSVSHLARACEHMYMSHGYPREGHMCCAWMGPCAVRIPCVGLCAVLGGCLCDAKTAVPCIARYSCSSVQVAQYNRHMAILTSCIVAAGLGHARYCGQMTQSHEHTHDTWYR